MAASATRVVGANDRVSVGVVGIGGRGRYHVNMWTELAGSVVGGLCDVNQAGRERGQAVLSQEGAPKAAEYRDMREMYESKEIDAVSIATNRRSETPPYVPCRIAE